LQRVSQEKDLGVTFDERLTFEQHILEKVKKEIQTMGLIRKSFSYLDIQSFRWLFKAMVRPHLEYAQSVWSPFRKKEIVTIEMVQRRATKMLPGLKELSYKESLKILDIPTLVNRRIRGDMIEMYKILNGRYDQDAEMQLPVNNNITRGHQKKLFKQHSKTKIRQSQFRLCVAETWNSLPEYVVKAPSIKSFERRLDKFWTDQAIRLVTNNNHLHSGKT